MRASTVRCKGTWTGNAADYVELDIDGRHRRRIALMTNGGSSILLDLAEAIHLKHGDGLVLDDGRIIEVRARREELLEVRGRDATHLAQLAWHLGNRHLAAQIEADRILIRRDHVIAHMLEHQGAAIRDVAEPFDPEAGAYAHGHDH